jgi:hypothetical protein
MASCERIAPLLQAYVDDELASWERLAVEHHVRDCVLCAEELREATSCTAALFDSLAPYKLSEGFRDRVMSNVPSKIPAVFGMRRGRSVRVGARIDGMSRWMLAGAVVVLLLALAIIVYYYPRPSARPVEIGMITAVEGSVSGEHAYGGNLREVMLRDDIFKGDRLLTGEGARLIVALEGPTQIKVNENSELWVDNERFIRLVRGELWGHVAGQGRVFKVQTPHGDVTVTGTEFNVRIADRQTSVAVATGKVLFATERGFTELSAGQMCSVERDAAPRDVRQVGVAQVGNWGRDLVAQTVDSRYTMTDDQEGPVGVLYVFKPARVMRIVNVLIRRDAYGTAPVALPGTFTVNLYDEHMKELATREFALSEFTGTNAHGRIVVDFSEDDLIADGRPFYVLLAPGAGVVRSLPVRTDVDVIKYTGEVIE